VADICRRVDGLPLGIELIASKLRVLSVDDVAGRLREDLVLPAIVERTRDPRHRSLASAIEWSYDLLSEAEAQLFLRLAVFIGGFSLRAAEAVCAEEDVDVVDVLARLAEKSLVVVGEGLAGDTRYRLLEVVREFAAERLRAAGLEDELRHRHLGFFVAFGDEAGRHLDASDHGVWYSRVDEELDNVRAALSVARDEDPERGLELVGALGRYWYHRCFFTEGRAWFDALLSATAAENTRRVRALIRSAALHYRSGDYQTMMAQSREALLLARRVVDPQLLPTILQGLAHFAITTLELDFAHELVDEQLKLARASGKRTWIAYALENAAMLASAEDRADARSLAEEAIATGRELGIVTHLMPSFTTLVAACLRERDVSAAAAALDEATRLRREVDDIGGLTYGLSYAAWVAAASGDAQRAMRLAGAASAAEESIGVVPSPLAARRTERYLEDVRNQLGHRASALWAEGRAMPLEEGVAYSLREKEALESRRPRQLTRRELEVATLLTDGLSNGEIAQRLTISARTVDAHVEHIRNKLGLRRRAQIAAWVTEENATASADT
jgi:DNA-binding CsgD family transcriptional regulator